MNAEAREDDFNEKTISICSQCDEKNIAKLFLVTTGTIEACVQNQRSSNN